MNVDASGCSCVALDPEDGQHPKSRETNHPRKMFFCPPLLPRRTSTLSQLPPSHRPLPCALERGAPAWQCSGAWSGPEVGLLLCDACWRGSLPRCEATVSEMTHQQEPQGVHCYFRTQHRSPLGSDSAHYSLQGPGVKLSCDSELSHPTQPPVVSCL